MKAAILNTYAKDYSTGKIAYGLYKFLKKQGDEVFLAYGQGKKYEEKDLFFVGGRIESKIHIALSRITGFPGCFSTRGTGVLLSKFDEYKPDVVFLFNLHGYYLNEYKLLKYLKAHNIVTFYVMLDEYPFMGKCGFNMGCEGYKSGCDDCKDIRRYPASYFFNTSARMLKMKKKAYDGFGNLSFVAIPYTLSLAESSTLLKGKRMYPADEAIDTNRFHPRNTTELKRKLGIADGEKIIVCIAVYPNERKGVQYFLAAARKIGDNYGIVFVHVGFGGDKSECPSNYIPISYVENQDELCEYYSLGDLFCFPSLNETLPSTCLEALACGSPLLLFNTSGMPYIADQIHSTLVEPGDVDGLVREIIKAPFKDETVIDSCRQYAIDRYDNRKYYDRLRNLAITQIQ